MSLLLDHGAFRVEVPQVVGGDRTEILEQLARQADLLREVTAEAVEHVAQHIPPVQPDGADPGEVVESDLVDEHPLRRDLEVRGDLPLEVDGDVAEADGPVAIVQQRPRDDPDRVGEIDDPRPVGGDLPRAPRDLEHDRDGAHRLRQSAGAGRLLSDAAAERGGLLVMQAGGLTADADLEQDRVGSVERAVEAAGQLERAVVPLPLQHPLRHRADDVKPFSVDVVQDELVYRDPLTLAHQPGDELRRVG